MMTEQTKVSRGGTVLAELLAYIDEIRVYEDLRLFSGLVKLWLPSYYNTKKIIFHFYIFTIKNATLEDNTLFILFIKIVSYIILP